jgi:uncharacterized membrane protein
MALILNYFPLGIRLYPILIALAVFILATSAVIWSAWGSLIRKKNSEHDLTYGCLFGGGRA